MCRPAAGKDEVTCAKQILTALARRAYRRPVTDGDLESLLTFYQAGRNKGAFDSGIENALRLILANPKFIFRAESDAGVAVGAAHRMSDLELASRLSFFPVEQHPRRPALDRRRADRLQDPAVLEQQVKRMLADPGDRGSLVDNFAGQWLSCATCATHKPDVDDFPDFDDNLRQAMRRETELFFESVLREDRSVLDLLNANYTFVNERLAKHYGIPNVHGGQFRRVTLTDENRRGLLGQGSILTVTSYPNRTSRCCAANGFSKIFWGRRRRPPPNVPALKENGDGKQLSLRQLMEQHRANPGLVRNVPSGDGPARPLARKLRRGRAVAHQGAGGADRCVGATGGRNKGGRRGGAAQSAAPSARSSLSAR